MTSKYTTLSNEEDIELNVHRHSYRDGSTDVDEDYNGHYCDEEIVIQPSGLQPATGSPPTRMRWLIFLTVAILAGGTTYFLGQNKIPENTAGLVGQLKGRWDDWRDSAFHSNKDELNEERGSDDYTAIVDGNNGLMVISNSAIDEKQIENEGGYRDKTDDNEKSADVEIEHIESANEQVEELQEELDEMADDEEDTQDIANQQEDTTEQDNGDIMMEDNESEKSDMNYSVGASNTISSDWSIVEQVDHDNTSFTQGLSYGLDNTIYETTGLYGVSKLYKINPITFSVQQSVGIDRQFFGEGSTFYIDAEGNGRIIEITWKSHTGFIYDADTLDTISTFQYTTTAPRHEGWGITYDESNKEFIVSDGSPHLYFWDRDSLEEKRKVTVSRFDGSTQNMLNELEFMDGLVCCNIWHQDEIICVDPTTGKSIREYDMSQLWPRSERGSSENVLNGIALGKDHVLVTGKRWDRMYKITLDDWPTLFLSKQAKSAESTNDYTEPAEEENIQSDTGKENVDTEQATADVVSNGDAFKSWSEEVEDIPDYFVPLTPDERAELKQRLQDIIVQTSSSLLFSANPSSSDGALLPQRTYKIDPGISKQFMHMHHMKTGGTSMDALIHCAISRQLKINNNTEINYSSMSECGSTVRQCMSKLAIELNATVIGNIFYYNDDEGKPIMTSPFDPAVGGFEETVGDLNICGTSDHGVMSYCTSLHTVRTFGWKDVDKVTIIRNPIDRAWSMYRYTLQSCYKCKDLKDVLKEVLNGSFVGRGQSNPNAPKFLYDPSDSCATQMIGHQATNLLSSIDLYNVANDVRFPREKEIVEEAVKNLRESFTWVGLTDRLEESVDGFRAVFPFLAENLTEAVLLMDEHFEAQGHPLEDARFALPEDYVDTTTCPFHHENAGRDPTCGTKEMDEETINMILKLNNRDKAVYQAAVERFDLQMEVLKEYRETFSR